MSDDDDELSVDDAGDDEFGDRDMDRQSFPQRKIYAQRSSARAKFGDTKPSFDPLKAQNRPTIETTPLDEGGSYDEFCLGLYELDARIPIFARMCERLDRLVAKFKTKFPEKDLDAIVETLRSFDTIEPTVALFQSVAQLRVVERRQLASTAMIEKNHPLERYFNGKKYKGRIENVDQKIVYSPKDKRLLATWNVTYEDGDKEV